MFSFGKRRYCVFGCADLGAYMHGFPHPDRRPEMFKKWMSVVGHKLVETDPMKVFKNKKVCSHHFPLDDKVASHRLKITAVPSLYLEGIFSSPSILIQLEHNYCINGAHSEDKEASTSSSTPNPIDIETPPLEVDMQSENYYEQGVQSTLETQSSLKAGASGSAKELIDIGKKQLQQLYEMHKNAQKNIRLLKAQLRKSKKKELYYKSRLSALTTTLSESTALKKVTKSMKRPDNVFTEMQFRHALTKPRGRRYSVEEKVMALSLYKKSPEGYSLFAKYFNLPSPKSLKNLLKDMKLTPGINKTVFENIKETVCNMNIEDGLCTFTVDVDEMSIDPHEAVTQ